MTLDDKLAQLTAGIEADDAVMSDWMRDLPTDYPEVWESGEYTHICVEPARFLRQVAAHRKIAELVGALHYGAERIRNNPDLQNEYQAIVIEEFTEKILDALAGIYREDEAV